MFGVPGKFVFLHWPRTGGTWAAQQLESGCPNLERLGPDHAGFDDIPDEWRHLPVVSAVRDPVDWMESHYSHRRHVVGFDSECSPLDGYRTNSVDMYTQDVIENHPAYLSQHAQAYADRADYVIRFERLIPEWTHFLRSHGIECNSDIVNSSPRRTYLSPEMADAWRISNADFCERYGYGLPPGPVYSLGDWAGHWRQSIELALSPRLRGRPVSLLEIGVCEGRGAQAAFEVLLRHPASTYTGVDVWAMNPRHRAERNISQFSEGRHVLHDAGTSDAKRLAQQEFDVIYIDGDHTEQACLRDLKTWWPAVSSGGFLVVDDYGSEAWPSEYPGVRTAVDQWAATLGGSAQTLHRGYQYIVRKCVHKPDGLQECI